MAFATDKRNIRHCEPVRTLAWQSVLLPPVKRRTAEGTRLHFHSPQGMKIKVRLGPALAGGARPRRI